MVESWKINTVSSAWGSGSGEGADFWLDSDPTIDLLTNMLIKSTNIFAMLWAKH